MVIGAEARYLDSPAADRIAGYAISNDISEREFQLERGGQWDKGKNCETFNPLGPWVLTADEMTDPQALGLRLWVNGELRQDGTTANMIFGVHHLIYYISQFLVLRPGDVVNTGTPAGVAMGMPNSPYLRRAMSWRLRSTTSGASARSSFARERVKQMPLLVVVPVVTDGAADPQLVVAVRVSTQWVRCADHACNAPITSPSAVTGIPRRLGPPR